MVVDLNKFNKGEALKMFWLKTNKDIYEIWRQKVYNCSKWRKIRLIVLELFPLCNICDRAASVDCDHIKPLFIVYSEGGDPYDIDGLQGVCKRCHGLKSIEDQKKAKNYIKF